MSGKELKTDSHTGKNSLAVAISNLVTSVLGALLGLVIVLIVGSSSETDAFLAAYSLYLLLVMFSATLRTSLVPIIGSADNSEEFRAKLDETLPKVLCVGLLAVAALLLLSPLFGFLLTRGLGEHAHTVAAVTLALLAPAGYLQIHAASLSAALGTAGRFVYSSLAYMGATVASLIVTTLLVLAFGIWGAPVGVLLSALAVMVAHAVYAGKLGLKPMPNFSWIRRKKARELPVRLIFSAAIGLALQFNLAIALSAVSSNEGEITVYTYAFFAISLLLGVSASSLNLVTVPGLISSVAVRGVAAGKEYIEKVVPHAFAVLIPTLAGFAAFGKPLLEQIFNGSLQSSEIDLLYTVSVIFFIMAFAMVYLMNIHVVTLAFDLQRWAAIVAVTSVPIQLVAVEIASSDGTQAVAYVHSSVVLLMALLLALLTFGTSAIPTVTRSLWRSLPAVAISAVYLVALVLNPGLVVSIVGLIACSALYIILAIKLWPDVGVSFRGLIAALFRQGSTQS